MGPTMKDVAALAGVSPKTVSNVVRGWPHVSPSTRKRVESALLDLGYRMNPGPSMLRSGRSGIIALAVPWLDSPYFAEITSAIVRKAEPRGWTVLVDQTDGRHDRELKVVQGLSGQPIDGLIYSPYALGSEDLLTHQPTRMTGQINSARVPMVLLGERIPAGRADHVAIDNVAAAVDVVTHLATTGRQRIAAIGYQDLLAGENARQRARGYELALRAAGQAVNPRLQAPVEAFERGQGYAAMMRLLDLEAVPDAVFCFSDLLALGAMHAVHERGLSVPHDVAIAGFDDIEDAKYSNPPLTTISPDKDRIAEAALEILAIRLDKGAEQPPPIDVSPDYQLVVRASTAT
jgi:DNA-binding LacI/PurR family transcriptional regulator